MKKTLIEEPVSEEEKRQRREKRRKYMREYMKRRFYEPERKENEDYIMNKQLSNSEQVRISPLPVQGTNPEPKEDIEDKEDSDDEFDLELK
jgi:hypothetical protein